MQLNPHVSAFHRNFVNEVKRCDEMERKLRFFEEQVIKEKGLNVTTMNLEAAGQESHNINIDDLEVWGMGDALYQSPFMLTKLAG